MDLMDAKETAQRLEKMVSNSSVATVLTAFIAEKAVEKLLRPNIRELKLVVRGRASDFVNGSADIKALKLVLDAGHKVFVNFDLHAKVYHIGDEILVGSSNLTSRGLLLGDAGNIELNTWGSPSDKTLQIINEVVSNATEINLDTLDAMDTFLQSKKPDKLSPKIRWPEGLIKERWVNRLSLDDLPEYKFSESFEEPTFWGKIARDKRDGKHDHAMYQLQHNRVYRWLYSLAHRKGARGAPFGFIREKIEVRESPFKWPREQVNTRMNNLYSFINVIDDEMETARPKHTEILWIKSLKK